MLRRGFVFLPGLFFLALWLPAQNEPAQKAPPPTPWMVPTEAAKQPNPIKSTPQSLEHAKKWWAIDCAMCHGKDGSGKGETGSDMKLQVPDLTNPAALKNRTDGEIFYIIKNGYQNMPPEGARLKDEEYWNLVNYVRSFAKDKSSENKAEAEPKQP